jgi:hypothetical protein
MMEVSGETLILVSVLLVAVCAVVYLTSSTKNGSRLNKDKYQTKWLQISRSLVRDNHATYPLAVMNADKLLDQALKDRHYKGATMGDRMKSATKSWSNADYVWGAHKIRNKIAHEPDFDVSYDTAARTLAAFKQALKDLGAI